MSKNVKKKETKESWGKKIWENVKSILIAVFIALFIRTFIIEAFKIPSGSMIPSLLIGDHLFVNKFVYGVKLPFINRTIIKGKKPERGEVVVFRYPRDESKDYIKRVIGVENDEIEIRDRVLYVNGEKIKNKFEGFGEFFEKDCRLTRGRIMKEHIGNVEHSIMAQDDLYLFKDFGPVKVKKGHIFVMGDNRDNSSDSRDWGQVPLKNIKGRAMIIWLSWNSCGKLSQKIRFDRFFKIVK